MNKVEVNYCSLCREYLTRTSKDEKIISDHCKSKKHLKWYYQSKKKEDEKEKAAAKAKSGAEASEAKKESVASASLNEGEKTTKKASAEKEVKPVEENNKT